MKTNPWSLSLLAFALLTLPCTAIPNELNYQGRVTVQGVNFSGAGQFKFALVDEGLNSSRQAYTTSTITGGEVVGSFPYEPGAGYNAAPAVTITGDGTGATATATVTNGGVTAITITTGGNGYTLASITIAPPPPSITYITRWSNDATSVAGAEPVDPVSIAVTQGLYSAKIGGGPSPMDPAIFSERLLLRVWFSDGVNGFQLLTPDQALAPAPYAFRSNVAETVVPGAIGETQLRNGGVTALKLADNAVSSAKMELGSVTNAKIADGSISASKIITTTLPASGQTLRYDGTQLVWGADTIDLPFSGSANSPGHAFSVSNNGTGTGLYGYSSGGDAISGWVATSGKSAIYGRTTTFMSGQGVYGYGQFAGVGVLGVSEWNEGVSGRTNGTGKSGVFGFAGGTDSSGVHGASALHHGVYAFTGSTNRAAIWADAPNGAEGIHGHSVGGDGVVGYTQGSGKAGVYGWTDRVGSRGAYFGHSNGGEALRTAGRAVIGGSLLVEGALTVQGAVDFQGVVMNISPVFGEQTIAYAPNLLVCGAYNDTTQFPLTGVKPLLQVGNGNSGLRSNALTILENGDAYVKNRLRAADVETSVVYAGDIYSSDDIVAEDVFTSSITASSIFTYKPGGGLWLPSLSDGRFKVIDCDFLPGLEEVAKIRPVRYRYKADNPDHLPSDTLHLGVIAQELQSAMPGAVITRPDGFLTVDLDQINWAVVNSIKQLKNENEALKKKLTEENTEIRKRLEVLEKRID